MLSTMEIDRAGNLELVSGKDWVFRKRSPSEWRKNCERDDPLGREGV